MGVGPCEPFQYPLAGGGIGAAALQLSPEQGVKGRVQVGLCG